MAGDGEGDLAAEVLLDEGEGQVDAGGDAGGGGEPVRRVRRWGPGRPRPPGGARASVSQCAQWVVTRRPSSRPGLGEQERAGADRDQPLGARARASRSQSISARVGAAGALAAGDEQGVRARGASARAASGTQGEAAGGADRRAVQGGGADAVRARVGAGRRRRRPPSGR